MEELNEIERQGDFIFPLNYKKFYEQCEISIPQVFVGTDLFNKYKELKTWALELINEDEVIIF